MEQTSMRSPELGVPLIPSVEQSPTPEQSREQIAAPAEQLTTEFVPRVQAQPVVPQVTPIAPTTSSVHQAIENILSEGLQEEYEQLDPTTQQRFRQVGEETATQIEVLLQSTKNQIQKIIMLITSWLKILPGVNSFFIQQEAKIKADKILKLHE
jgi:hypothetical protein